MAVNSMVFLALHNRNSRSYVPTLQITLTRMLKRALEDFLPSTKRLKPWYFRSDGQPIKNILSLTLTMSTIGLQHFLTGDTRLPAILRKADAACEKNSLESNLFPFDRKE
jgi:hypothetical protein